MKLKEISTNEYVQLAARVYDRKGTNRMFIPNGFEEKEWLDDDPTTGFSAGVYKKGDNVIISFTGTNEDLWKDFIKANIPGGTGWGWGSEQICQAFALVLRTIKKYPNAKLSFTGHSLGGGLASLMAVFFDKPAYTFDMAPFKNSARNINIIMVLYKYMRDNDITNQDFENYVNSLYIDPVELYEYSRIYNKDRYRDEKIEKRIADINFAIHESLKDRERNVEHWYTSGEILNTIRPLPPFAYNISGKDIKIDIGQQTLGKIDRHSIILLQALLRNDNFRQAVSRLPNSLELFASTKLYATESPEYNKIPDFMTDIVKQDAGGYEANHGVYTYPYPVLSHLASDMDKIAESNNNRLKQDAILAQLIEWYYYQTRNYKFREDTGFFFKDNKNSNVLQYTLTKNIGLPIVKERSRHYADPWLTKYSRAGVLNEGYLSSNIAGANEFKGVDVNIFYDKEQWTVSADNVNNTSAKPLDTARKQLMLGEKGADNFTGGDKEDLLVGAGGNDTLRGGAGNDVIYTGYMAPKEYVDTYKNRYIGDISSTNSAYGGKGSDTIYGDTSIDYLYGADDEKGGDDTSTDYLYGGRGKDYLFGGAGDDYLYGGYDEKGKGDNAKNILKGGKGDDHLYGDDGNDELYGEDDNDTLVGNGGRDSLDGGDGYDTYEADEEDTILDSDGKGRVFLNGKLLSKAILKKGDNVFRDQYGNTYEWPGNGIISSNLTINGKLTIIDYRKNGDLGITLEVEQEEVPPPEPPPASPPFKDPLSLDLDGDGQVNTLPRRAGVYFDLDNSGFAEQTAWLAPGDGFLVLDRNNNGHIDGGAELFGSETTLNNGKVAENGFEALAEWDSNADGKITAEDAIYHRLRIWQDKNSNGVVNSGELNTLQAHGIAEIHLDYQNGFWDENDIRHREIGHFTRADGTPGDIHTLWFDNDPVHSVPVENQQGRDVEIPAEISALPDAKGFGNVYPLRYAMALDKTGTLQKLVTQFVQEKDPATRHVLTDQIMARWTGKENVTPGSRGVYADAGQLAILEAFWGSVADERDLNWRNGDWIKTAYKQLHNMVYRQLASQTHYKALYGAVDFYQDENVWRADMAKVNQQLLQAFASGMMSAEEIHDFLINTVGGSVIDNETLLHDIKQSIINDAKMLPDAKMNSLLKVVMHDNDIITGNDEDNYIVTYGGDDQVKGMAGNDTINTGSGNDKAYGGLGDDTLYGGEGDDYLDGGEGNDTVYGGEDDDVLRGEDGADVYIFKGSWGKDTIYDDQSENRIHLEDCSLEDIRFSRINGKDLLVRKLGTENEILIKAQFSDEGVLDACSITQWEFADGRVLSSTEVNKLLHQGTDGDDVMEGDAYDNILAGKAGNDSLHGNDGNDEIDGGDGDDHLHGDGGDDRLDGGNGNDTLDGGDGADILAGGKGDDSYIIGDNDTVILGESMGSDHLYVADGKHAPLKNVTIQLDIPITPEQVQVIRKDFNDAVTGVDDYSLFNPEMPLSTPKGKLKDTFSEIRYMLSAHLPSLEKGRDYLVGSLGDAQDWKLPKDRAFVLNVDRGIPFDNAFSQWTRQDQYYLKFDTVSKHYFTITPKPGISNDLLLNFGSAGQLTIDNGLSRNLYGDITLSFKNGSKMSISELLQRQLDAAQTDGNDVIRGFASNDYLRGGAGNDILQGGEGNDSLEGGVGDDILSGGYYSLYWNTPESIYKGHYQYQYQASKSDRNLISGPDKYSSTPSPGLGNDTYIFFGAFGHDTVIDCDETKGNIDTLWFKDIASLEELNFREVENNLVIATKDNRSSVTVINQFSKEQPHWGVESIQLGNGQAMKLDDVFLAPLMTKGSEHDDVLVNTSNQDIRIDGYAGNDTITSGAGNDTINGGDGNDTIDAGGGDDIIDGGNGDDRIDGGAGNDIITGGSGNDNMTGGDGDDEFIFSKGWGQDYIWSTWTRDLSNDVIRFTDVTPDEISLRQQMGNIILSRKGSNDFISLRGNTGIISKVIFADGSEWNTTKLLELSLSSTEDADTIETDTPDVTIRGGGGDDVINARNGTNNRLYGDAGNDTISGDGELYGGDGNDSLFGMGKLYGEAGDDSLRGGSALYGGDGNDVLFLYRKEPGDTRPLYGDGGDGDDILRTSGVPSAYGEGVGTVAPSKGESVVTLRGGKGNDTIYGSYDNEVYEFSLGDGHDVIIEREAELEWYYSNLKASWDVLRFGSDIKAGDIRYLRQGRDLLIRHKNGTDSITVQNFFYTENAAYHHYRINEVQFADGTTHTDSDIDRFVTQGSHQGNNKNSKMAANVVDFSGGQHSRPMANNVAPAGVSADVIDQTALHHAQNLVQAMSTFDQRGINTNSLNGPDDSNLVNKMPLAPSL